MQTVVAKGPVQAASCSALQRTQRLVGLPVQHASMAPLRSLTHGVSSAPNKPISGRLQQAAGPLRSTALEVPAILNAEPDVGVSPAASSILQYAINMARASETYEVHSWMLLLGILKNETCTAAKVLKSMGLDDLYGAWHEVLWALNVCDGLQPRAFSLEIKFANRAFKVITASADFASWHGKDTVYSEDLLMALAAGGILDGLFPDLNLTFERVRKAVEKTTGRKYQLPDEPEKQPAMLKSDDEVFL